MLKQTLRSVALCMVAAPAFASPQFMAKQAATERSASGMIGAAVKNAAGETVGDINHLVVADDGRITTVVIGVGGFLGIGEKNVGVGFKDVSQQPDKDGKLIYILNSTKEELNGAPKYQWTEQPTTTKNVTSE